MGDHEDSRSTSDHPTHRSNETDTGSNSSCCIWLGVDFGTTHSSVAVWDSTRGRPKWLRLNALAYPEAAKAGRLVPSCLLLATRRVTETFVPVTELMKEERLTIPSSLRDLYVCVGASAMNLLEQVRDPSSRTSSRALGDYSEQQVSAALVTSLKRKIIASASQESPSMTASPTNIAVTPLGTDVPVEVDAVYLVSMFLSSLCHKSLQYLSSRSVRLRKKLRPPCGPMSECRLCRGEPEEEDFPARTDRPKTVPKPVSGLLKSCHIIVGIPAQCQARLAGDAYPQLLRSASTLTQGMTASLTTIVESTAAAMAYGLLTTMTTRSVLHDKMPSRTILVFDMGGGTTDVTIATESRDENDLNDEKTEGTKTQGWRVILTEGAPVGGDDLDELLSRRVLQHIPKERPCNSNEKHELDYQNRKLLRQCQRAKEELCGDPEKRDAQKEAHVSVQGMRVLVTQADLQDALEPWLVQARRVVEKALERLQASSNHGNKEQINEVILVGGSSRVPAVRTMLRSIFPHINELCVSVNPMSAVAQGAAIQAAIDSRLVPLYEVRSAMMLDTLPYAIGILTADDKFVEVLPQHAKLPAKGFAAFQLASASQPGISFRVVEFINEELSGQTLTSTSFTSYHPIKEFSFLLHRLTRQGLEDLDGMRSVQIGMIMRTSGELVVSIFDPNDPEHLAKRARVESAPAGSDSLQTGVPSEKLGYLRNQQGTTGEQVMLYVIGFLVLVLYLLVKLLFTEERVSGLIQNQGPQW